MAIEYLHPDERLSARACIFVSCEAVKAQPLVYVKRLNLACWAGVPARHIRDGLHMTHLKPRRAHKPVNYMVAWQKHHDCLRSERYAVWRENGNADLITRLETVRRQLENGAKLLAACKPYTVYTPSAEVPF